MFGLNLWIILLSWSDVSKILLWLIELWCGVCWERGQLLHYEIKAAQESVFRLTVVTVKLDHITIYNCNPNVWPQHQSQPRQWLIVILNVMIANLEATCRLCFCETQMAEQLVVLRQVIPHHKNEHVCSYQISGRCSGPNNINNIKKKNSYKNNGGPMRLCVSLSQMSSDAGKPAAFQSVVDLRLSLCMVEC